MPHSVPFAARPARSCFDRAGSFLEARRIYLALPLFDEAERLGFDPDQCAGGRWHCHMLRGDFQSAWHQSDQIKQRGATDPNRLWSGGAFQGKRVIVRCLHGLGDAIQFIRYVALLRQQASRVYVEVPGCLVRLFRCLNDVDAVITWEAPEPDLPVWDEQVEVMEFPWIYRTSIDSIPGSVPYIIPNVGNEVQRDIRTLSIGFAWAASSWNPLRSIPLSLLRPVLSSPRIASYSLQVGEGCHELASVPLGLRPLQVLANDADVLSTAELIGSMDLVITVDTMIAHLAGALGRPVWLLLAYPGDWRWMLDRNDSPWYPTMRIFRQKEDRDWPAVVSEVRQALDAFKRRPDKFRIRAEEALWK